MLSCFLLHDIKRCELVSVTQPMCYIKYSFHITHDINLCSSCARSCAYLCMFELCYHAHNINDTKLIFTINHLQRVLYIMQKQNWIISYGFQVIGIIKMAFLCANNTREKCSFDTITLCYVLFHNFKAV